MATPDGWADIPDELSAAGITDDLLVITELSFIKQLGWYDLWIVAVVSLIPCIPMLVLFEWQRHRRTHFWPKARYQPGRGLSSQFPGVGAWAMGILRAPDEEACAPLLRGLLGRLGAVQARGVLLEQLHLHLDLTAVDDVHAVS